MAAEPFAPGDQVRHRDGWTGTVRARCVGVPIVPGRSPMLSHGICYLVVPSATPWAGIHVVPNNMQRDTGKVWTQPARPTCYTCEKPATSAEGGAWSCGRKKTCRKWGEQMRPVYPGEKLPAGVTT